MLLQVDRLRTDLSTGRTDVLFSLQHVAKTNAQHAVDRGLTFHNSYWEHSHTNTSTSTHFLATDPSLSLPPSPARFLWRPLQHPGAPFPSTVQAFPPRLPTSEVHSSPRAPPPSSTSNKRCRTPVCCYSREACLHGRPAPGQLRALCIHETPQHTHPYTQFYFFFFFAPSKVSFKADF